MSAPEPVDTVAVQFLRVIGAFVIVSAALGLTAVFVGVAQLAILMHQATECHNTAFVLPSGSHLVRSAYCHRKASAELTEHGGDSILLCTCPGATLDHVAAPDVWRDP